MRRYVPKDWLEWQEEPLCDAYTWEEALARAEAEGYEWRLPTVDELTNCSDAWAKQTFEGWFWSETEAITLDPENPMAWGAQLGKKGSTESITRRAAVWLVRGERDL